MQKQTLHLVERMFTCSCFSEDQIMEPYSGPYDVQSPLNLG